MIIIKIIETGKPSHLSIKLIKNLSINKITWGIMKHLQNNLAWHQAGESYRMTWWSRLRMRRHRDILSQKSIRFSPCSNSHNPLNMAFSAKIITEKKPLCNKRSLINNYMVLFNLIRHRTLCIGPFKLKERAFHLRMMKRARSQVETLPNWWRCHL